MRTSEERKLPAGWTWASLGDLVRVIRGVTYKKEDARDTPSEGCVPIVKANNIKTQLTFDDLVFVPKRYVSEDQYLRRGDIVLAASSGSKRVVGKAAPLHFPWQGSFGAFCFALRPYSLVNARYLALFLQSDEYRHKISEQSAGVNINNIRAIDLEMMPVPLPPMGEQERIVTEVETHLTRLSSAIETLRRVQASLKRYRAAVLKAACNGRLTGTGALETGGGESAHPTYALPNGWAWVRLSDVGEIMGGLTKNASREKLGTRLPYLRVANVYAGELRLEDVRTIGVSPGELNRALLKPNDLLIVEGNGSEDQIGRVALWMGAIAPCLHQNHIIKVRSHEPGKAKYALIWLLSPFGRDFIRKVASSTSGLYTLSLSKVGSIPIAVPPPSEQRTIIEEVERRLSVAEGFTRLIQDNLQRATNLRQTILRHAFSGKLVPQDPNAEPASVLLETIRQSRAAENETNPRRRGRKLEIETTRRRRAAS